MTLTLGLLTFTTGSYKFTEADEQPNWEIKISRGCGTNAFPTVDVFRQNYSVFPMEVLCVGASMDTVKTNRDAVYAELVAANTKAREVLLTRTPTGMTTPDVWTVLGGVPRRIRPHWDGLKKMWIGIELYVFPGTRT
jgi:hypothetical protein